MAEVSATEEPEIPLRNVVATTFTTDNPPRRRTRPMSTLAKATRRRAMPPSAMIAPASTKKGIVSMANLLTPSEIFSITASSGMPIQSAPTSAAMPSEKAMGTPLAKQMNSVARRIRISIGRLSRDSVGPGRRACHDGVAPRRRADRQTLDDKEQERHSADGDRQIGDTDGKERKFRDALKI